MTTRLRPAFFDRLYAEDPDPWDFETSAYEGAKYHATIAALEGRRYQSALEVGCSIGVLTALLAQRCDRLLSIDVAEKALARARERMNDQRHVTIEHREVPEEFPAGPFDLIVCSEVLYYLDVPAFDATLTEIDHTLAPGGSLIAVHWRPATKRYPLLGDEVHERLATALGTPALRTRTDAYILERYDRPA
jgi:predicted TPR repeat methyltransferase